jgi:hypothetical protein
MIILDVANARSKNGARATIANNVLMKEKGVNEAKDAR